MTAPPVAYTTYYPAAYPAATRRHTRHTPTRLSRLLRAPYFYPPIGLSLNFGYSSRPSPLAISAGSRLAVRGAGVTEAKIAGFPRSPFT